MTADIIFSILNLLLSITAIWIAITSSRKTAKDTTKQIESIKQLSRIQIETSIKQLDTEIRKNILRAEQAKEEWNGIQAINNSGLAYQTDWRNEMMRRHQERKPGMELQFYNSYIKNLEDIRKSLTGIKNRLDQQ